MSKALVLDFGGVVTRTLFETHRETEAALGLPKGSLNWRGPFAPDTDELWHRMINNEISERDYWLTRSKEIGAMIGCDWTSMQEFVIAARSERPIEIIRPEFLDTELCQAKWHSFGDTVQRTRSVLRCGLSGKTAFSGRF